MNNRYCVLLSETCIFYVTMRQSIQTKLYMCPLKRTQHPSSNHYSESPRRQSGQKDLKVSIIKTILITSLALF